MELKLNIYDNNKIIKTFTTDEMMITTGFVEDLLEVINIDDILSDNGDVKKAGESLFRWVMKDFKKFKSFITRLFGMTDDEFRMTAASEVGEVIMQIIGFAIGSLMTVGNDKKK